MKILVIEDSVLLADTIAEALQNENYAVDIANDGQLGYEHASTGIYDMVILDLMLPKMNGYEVLSALRRDGDNVPVLILSAKTEIDDKIPVSYTHLTASSASSNTTTGTTPVS